MLAAGQPWVVVGEEPGWRGLALPGLQRRVGSLGAALAVGPLWDAWHLPMLFVHDSFQYGEPFWRSLLTLTAWSILLAVLYWRSGGSAVTTMIGHAAMNIWGFAVATPAGAANWTLGAWWVLAAVAIAFLPRPLFAGRPHPQPQLPDGEGRT